MFVGRVISAAGGMRELQEAESAAEQAEDAAPEEFSARLEEVKRAYLNQYGSRLDEAQRAWLLNVKSERELSELVFMIALLGRPVEFEVVERVIGDLPRSLEVFTGRGGGDCGFDFSEGETYLVEAQRRPNGELHAWLCSSRVAAVKSATEELRTLRAWKRGEPLAPRIYGYASDWTRRRNDQSRGYPPAAGLALTLSQKEAAVQTKTDETGRFQFEDLEHAEYSLRLGDPRWSLIRVSDGQRPIDLTSTGCAVLSLLIREEQGAIAGRVVPYAGEELPDHLWIEAVAKNPGDAEPSDATAKAPDGAFEIDEMEPGDYFVAINVGNSPTGPHYPNAEYGRVWPYGPTYYPGVTDREKAALFHVERGQTIRLEDWTLPARLSERRITGAARLPNGSPAADVRITLRRPGLKEVVERSGPTSGDGQFVVWPLETLEYVLEAASYDPDAQVVYRGSLEISAEEEGPIILRLEATDEKPTDDRYFSGHDWRKR
ncbi:MAG: hypothetical protein GC160_20935 [Acidobacteria bacterium]|nr:hypothetical protein [Acidobacteriota bacterium]